MITWLIIVIQVVLIGIGIYKDHTSDDPWIFWKFWAATIPLALIVLLI